MSGLHAVSRWVLRSRAPSALALAIVVGCLGCSGSEELPRVDPPPCVAGSDGCPCLADGTCVAATPSAPLECLDGTCRSPACVAGTLGCACLEGETCAEAGLACAGNVCQRVGCTPGSPGCACASGARPCQGEGVVCSPRQLCTKVECPPGNEGCACSAGTCNRGYGGGVLSCDATTSRCINDACPAGRTGCACLGAYGCDDSAATCKNGFCVPAGCTAGTAGCGCTGGTCNAGLSCFGNRICVDNIGVAGGPCDASGGCQAGALCSEGQCIPCIRGTQACTCADAQPACSPGLECEQDRCVATDGLALEASSEVKCHSPCTPGTPAGPAGELCSAEGLVGGCPDGLVCKAPGQCLLPNQSPIACQRDVECPSFQACRSGYCRSDCDSSSDCKPGAVCAEKVCRQVCDLGVAKCPTGQYCNTFDGFSGHCLALQPASTTLADDEGLFATSSRQLRFGGGVDSASLTVTNLSDKRLSFTVRKARQKVTSEAGAAATAELSERWDRDAPKGCLPGTFGCTCGPDSACGKLVSGLSLVCDTSTPSDHRCRLPKCEETSESAPIGCVCRGANCRRLCQEPDCPLSWLKLTAVSQRGVTLASGQDVAVEFPLGPRERATVKVEGGEGRGSGAWSGALEIDSGGLRQTVFLRHASRPEGAWTGSVYLFGDFPVNEEALTTWQQDKAHASSSGLANAFLKAWAKFRRQEMDARQFDELLNATRDETWRQPAVQAKCFQGNLCYPTSLRPSGVEIYTSEPMADPVPSGVVELPFAIHLGANATDPLHFEGRIETRQALQYPGNPKLTLDFEQDPVQCALHRRTCTGSCRSGFECKDGLCEPDPDHVEEEPAVCLAYLKAMSAQALVGGRSLRVGTAACPTGFVAVDTPWLVPGLVEETGLAAAANGGYRRQECRDKLGETDAGRVALNASLASANPLPNGERRRRVLELVDGALIDNRNLFVLFRERVELGGTSGLQDLVSYGFMRLTRSEAGLSPTDDDSLPPPPPSTAQPVAVYGGCSARMLALETGTDDARWDRLAATLLGEDTELLPPIDPLQEQAHYLCVETGRFDRGQLTKDGDEDLTPCPPGSNVIYFTTSPTVLTQANIDAATCRSTPLDPQRGCLAQLKRWEAQGALLQVDAQLLLGQYGRVLYGCADGTTCVEDRWELRKNKVFFARPTPTLGTRFLPLQSAVADAFRYRTRFQNRGGTQLGFAPQICARGGETFPYCYDPDGLHELEERFDCLLDVYLEHGPSAPEGNARLTAEVGARVGSVLHESFASVRVPDGNNQFHDRDGFEKLRAELLIMLGDDALTLALSSRFDLAGLNVGDFDGPAFEPGGEKLSGVAGAEMNSLYRATQYYQLVLDRFFRLLPPLAGTVDDVPPVLDGGSVATWFDRVIRASAQKARASREIATRYQAFGQASLARRVIERAYNAAYLESVAMTHLMRTIVDASASEYDAQILRSLQQAQLTYRIAFDGMREQYGRITDALGYFGFAPDYIPFPATEGQVARDNGFEVLAARAWQRVQVAQQAEDLALQSTRSFDTDAASFQAELARVENTYESQLSELCGTFTAQVGGVSRAYPAIRKYAYLDTRAAVLGNPCGQLGTGQIADAIQEMSAQILDVKKTEQEIANVLENARIERQLMNELCRSTDAFKKVHVNILGRQHSLDTQIDDTRLTQEMSSCLHGVLNNLMSLPTAAMSLHYCGGPIVDQTLGAFPDDIDCSIFGPFSPAGYASDAFGGAGGWLEEGLDSAGDFFGIGGAPGAESGGLFGDIGDGLGDLVDLGDLSGGGGSPWCSGLNVALDVARQTSQYSLYATTTTLNALQAQRRWTEDGLAAIQYDQQCRVDANGTPYGGSIFLERTAAIQRILAELSTRKIDLLRAQIEVQQAASRIQQQRQQASRIEAEMEEMEQLTIDVEAARNNPNVRIYRNDAVINADLTFYSALREVYKATRVFEYFTSQSYAKRNQLFQVRMVARGDNNLQNYLTELEDAFRDFEDLYGTPDLRVERLSLLDDILRIPRVDARGVPLSSVARTRLLRQRLQDPALRDAKGYIAIPFSTSFEQLSPLTRNHKLKTVQAQIGASNYGDETARVYLRMRGTGSVWSVDGKNRTYVFPERTAVINAFFLDKNVFDESVYKCSRLNDRPFVNTHWELVINTVDEAANRDLSLEGIDDVRLYLYYTDFTVY